MINLTVIYPNIGVEVLIILVAILFVGAFVVCPFFFGKCFVGRKISLVDAQSANDLVANTKSLSKVEVQGSTLLLSRASEAHRGTFEISAKGSKGFKMNKKVVIDFGSEETVKIEFDKDIVSVYLVEIYKGNSVKPIFLSDFVSAVIIGAAQLIAFALMAYLTVYAFEGFNIPNSRLYKPGYVYAYATIALALVVGVISFIFNYKRMKLFQKPLKNSRKGGK